MTTIYLLLVGALSDFLRTRRVDDRRAEKMAPSSKQPRNGNGPIYDANGL